MKPALSFILEVGAVGAAAHANPRLFLDDAALTALTAQLTTDATLQRYLTEVTSRGIMALARPPTPFPNCTAIGLCRDSSLYGPGASYLDAGGASNIIMYCSLLHRLNVSAGNATAAMFGARALNEMLHVANFSSWYWPVGEALERSSMAFGVAVGYDLLFNTMTPQQRAAIEDALGTMGLQTRLQDGREGMWWLRDEGNWAINSNAPLMAVAAAIGDVPRWARPATAVLQSVMADMLPALALYEPGGVWPEGPTYGMFSQQWLAQGCTGANSLVACSWPADGGLCAAGRSTLLLLGPTMHTFNWADAHEEAPYTSTLFYAAAQCGAPVLAAAARALRVGGGASYLDLLWYSAAGSVAELEALPLSAVFADPSTPKTHVGAFRSAWTWASGNASAAVWVAFKGGDNAFALTTSNNHGHQDVGTWVLEAGGYRWIIDLGPDAYDYPLLSYFGRFRWGYYVPSSGGHNVLQLGGDAQHRAGRGVITGYNVLPGTPPWASLDTTSAYGGALNVSRLFSLLPATGTPTDAPSCARVTISDAWTLSADHPAATVTWRAHTRANVTLLGGGRVRLWLPSGETLTMTATTPGGGGKTTISGNAALITWSEAPISLPPPQGLASDKAGVRLLVASVDASAGGIDVVADPCAAG